MMESVQAISFRRGDLHGKSELYLNYMVCK